MLVVLVVASGATWESSALTILTEDPGIVVLKRCVDVDDLLASAASGQAQAAVLGVDAPGLDAAAVEHLRAAGVRPVAVIDEASCEAAGARAARIGIPGVVTTGRLSDLPSVLTAPESPTPVAGSSALPLAGSPPGPIPETAGSEAARTIVVWGAAGAPGRSTVAAGIAAELARRCLPTVLVDADPYGGTLAQQLGVLDEASGLLTAARLSTSGDLGSQFGSTARALDEHLCLVSGLPRADRWVELRSGTVEHLIETAAHHGRVVVDTGFSLEQEPGADFGSRPGRNQATLDALGVADEVVVVAAADPVGLSRLARGLVELRDHLPDICVRVAINRMRPTLGWSEQDIAAVVSGFAPLTGISFLPDDPETVDRALVTGRSLLECGDSPIVRALSDLVDSLSDRWPDQPRSRRSLRRRRVGTTHRR